MQQNFIHKSLAICYNQSFPVKHRFGENKMSEVFDERKKRLFTLLKEKSLGFGEVVLSSGEVSNYYFDAKMVTLTAEGAYLVGSIILDIIKDLDVDAVGGLTMGADPIVGSVTALSYGTDMPVKAFIVRKEPKKHGKKKWIEGPLVEGDKVLVVDDVVTTGDSIVNAIKRIEEYGCKVVKVISLVDRFEGGYENLKENGYTLESLFTAEDFGVKKGVYSQSSKG
ncbi:MAG: orotate phosphoribosyltransferase [Candidatus Humimicrobiaceae bacterium]